ncbi:MAG: sporulation protein YqfC [Firmicutes bacterium]|nr:sporulation protein YqfC [Bacillota bacterium]
MLSDIKKYLARSLELPTEAVLNLPLVTLTGFTELCIENHRGIIEYTDSVLRVNTAQGALRIEGRALILHSLTSEALTVTGRISRIETVL